MASGPCEGFPRTQAVAVSTGLQVRDGDNRHGGGRVRTVYLYTGGSVADDLIGGLATAQAKRKQAPSSFVVSNATVVKSPTSTYRSFASTGVRSSAVRERETLCFTLRGLEHPPNSAAAANLCFSNCSNNKPMF